LLEHDAGYRLVEFEGVSSFRFIVNLQLATNGQQQDQDEKDAYC
jgi:hypothetical protein